VTRELVLGTVLGVVAGEEGGEPGFSRRSRLTIAGVVRGDNCTECQLRCSGWFRKLRRRREEKGDSPNTRSLKICKESGTGMARLGPPAWLTAISAAAQKARQC
jgi:hypothetical protein